MLPRALGLSIICLGLVACADGLDNPHRGNPTSPTPAPIQNYAGKWSGTYTVTGCSQSGFLALANVCAILGTTPAYSLSFTQSDHNVSGSFTVGTLTFPSTGGTVGQDGSLALSGVSRDNDITTIANVALQFPSSMIIGTITQYVESPSLTGSVVIVGTINSAIRASVTP